MFIFGYVISKEVWTGSVGWGTSQGTTEFGIGRSFSWKVRTYVNNYRQGVTLEGPNTANPLFSQRALTETLQEMEVADAESYLVQMTDSTPSRIPVPELANDDLKLYYFTFWRDIYMLPTGQVFPHTFHFELAGFKLGDRRGLNQIMFSGDAYNLADVDGELKQTLRSLGVANADSISYPAIDGNPSPAT